MARSTALVKHRTGWPTVTGCTSSSEGTRKAPVAMSSGAATSCIYASCRRTTQGSFARTCSVAPAIAAKAGFRDLAPALPQPLLVFIGWMLGLANGPMRAYTSFGTP
jgi:hypothetical protein